MFPMKTFQTTDARTLSYQAGGNGPLLVLLPGGPGLDPVSYFAGAVVPGFRQLVFCPRGTGLSDPPASPEGYRIAGYVSDVEELRNHLGAEQLTLCGSSHGATIALAYAIAHPERVDRMILAGGPARMDAAFWQASDRARERFRATATDGADRLDAADAAGPAMRSAGTDAERRDAMRIVMNTYLGHPSPTRTGLLERLVAAPMNFAAPEPMIAEMMSGLDLLRDAATMTVRTLVIGAELDVRVPTEHLQEIVDAIPGAQLALIAGAGHLAHLEASQQWAETVGDFLRGNSRA